MNLAIDCTKAAQAASDSADQFFNSSAGELVASFGALFGIIVLLFGLFKVVKAVMSGKPGAAIMAVAGTAIACAFLFQPGYAINLINLGSQAVGALFSAAPDSGGCAPTP